MRQPASLFCNSTCQGWLARRQLCCLASGCPPCTSSISSHFTKFPNVTGAPPAAALGFAYILSPCGPFKWQKSSSFFCHHNLHWFSQPEVMGVYLTGARTMGCVVWPRTGIAHSQGIPPDFLSAIRERGAVHSTATTCLHHHAASPPHLHNSSPPAHLDERGFFKSLVVGLSTAQFSEASGYYLFLRSGCNSFYGCTRR